MSYDKNHSICYHKIKNKDIIRIFTHCVIYHKFLKIQELLYSDVGSEASYNGFEEIEDGQLDDVLETDFLWEVEVTFF